MGDQKIKIFLIDNDGGGFADTVEVDNGTTVSTLFCGRHGDRSPSDYTIRVNREPVNHAYVLKESDRVSFTPSKVNGA